MSEQWYLSRNEQQFGPYTLKQMQEYIGEGRITKQDLVWKEGLTEWTLAEHIPYLFTSQPGIDNNLIYPSPVQSHPDSIIPPQEPLDEVKRKKFKPFPVILAAVLLIILGVSAYIMVGGGIPVSSSPENEWKKQADYKQEKKVIDGLIDEYSLALKNQDVEGAANYFAPDQQDFYRSVFSQSTETMPDMAKDLKTAKMTFLSIDEGLVEPEFNRIAEYEITCDGYTFSILFMKEQDRWVIVQM